jgi:hypothetical protein
MIFAATAPQKSSNGFGFSSPMRKSYARNFVSIHTAFQQRPFLSAAQPRGAQKRGSIHLCAILSESESAETS